MDENLEIYHKLVAYEAHIQEVFQRLINMLNDLGNVPDEEIYEYVHGQLYEMMQLVVNPEAPMVFSRVFRLASAYAALKEAEGWYFKNPERVVKLENALTKAYNNLTKSDKAALGGIHL